MWYAKLNKHYYIEFVKDKCPSSELVPYKWILSLDEWTIHPIPIGFVMVKEGVMLINDNTFELFTKGREDKKRAS